MGNPSSKSAFAGALLIALLSTTEAAPADPSTSQLSFQDLEAPQVANLTYPPRSFTVAFEPTTGAGAGTFAETDAQQVSLLYMLHVAACLYEHTFDPIALRTPNENLELGAGGWPEPSSPIEVNIGLWGIWIAILAVHKRQQLAFGRWYLVSAGDRKGFLEFRKPANEPLPQPDLNTPTQAALPLSNRGEVTFRTEATEIELRSSWAYFYSLIDAIGTTAAIDPTQDILSFFFMGFDTQGIKCKVFQQGQGGAPRVRRGLVLALYKEMAVPREYVKTKTTMFYFKNHQIVHDMMECTVGIAAGDAAGQVAIH